MTVLKQEYVDLKRNFYDRLYDLLANTKNTSSVRYALYYGDWFCYDENEDDEDDEDEAIGEADEIYEIFLEKLQDIIDPYLMA